MTLVPGPFRGSEALEHGRLSRHQLRTHYRPVFPDVYLPKAVVPTLRQRTIAAYLWSQRDGVVTGLAAAAFHGSKWIDQAVDVEMLYRNPRAPRGIVVRREFLLEGEFRIAHGMALTAPARTCFDLARQGDVGTAVARVDALGRVATLDMSHVSRIAERHPGVRGLRQLETVLSLVDIGAESPKETWLRLVLVRAGLPRPQTQIPVYDGDDDRPFAYLDMGWRDWLVAVEYDGDQHRSDRWQYVKDIRRRERLERMGWIVVTVVAEDRAQEVVRRVRDALDSRVQSPGCNRQHATRLTCAHPAARRHCAARSSCNSRRTPGNRCTARSPHNRGSRCT